MTLPMDSFKNIMNALFDILLWPFKSLPPMWGLFFISIITGVFMLYIFKYTSNQEGIRRTKDKLKGFLLELRLYKDDVSLSLTAIKNIFVSNIRYLGFAFKPMIIIMVPMIFIIIQLASRYEYQPLSPGDETIISLTVKEDTSLPDIKLAENQFVQILAPPVRIPTLNQVNWRIKALKEGDWNLVFNFENQSEKKMLIVGRGLVQIAPTKVEKKSLNNLLYMAEPSISKDSFIKSISIQYPHRFFKVLNTRLHWFLFFLLFSLLAGFSLKRLLGVEL